MAEQLTKQQKLAVDDRGGDLLVSAAAGSGKTKVLVERLMQCITDPVSPANIDDFLIITYTKAAASELRSKIAKALTQRIAAEPGNMRLQQQFQRLYLAKISTVHAFCADILREFSYVLDISGDFRMMEEQEDKPLRAEILDRVLSEAYENIENEPDLVAFVDTQGVGRDDRHLPELILKVYDSAKCHMDSEGWLNRCLAECDTTGVSDVGQTIWGRYLIEHLFESIDLHLQSVNKAAESCDCAEGLEKMTAIMYRIAEQLKHLRAAKNWDEVYQRKQIDYGDLHGAAGKKNADKGVYAAAKVVRDFCMKDMKALLEDFGNDSRCVLQDLENIYPAVKGLMGLVDRFSKRYDRTKKAMRVMDFSDLEHRTLDLLLGKSRSGPTTIAKQIGNRFCQIMVDEYQDSNQVQDAIFSAITKDRNNLFMVGDVKQSIYQFRLADPGIFLEKYRRFLPAEEAMIGQGRKIVLSNNFRSGPEIIDAVNSVFRSCMSPRVGGLHYGDDEALWEGVPREPLPETAVSLHVLDVESDTYAEEAAYVAEQITQLLDGTHFVRGEEGLRPIIPEDIAILLRSPKTSGAEFHYALQMRGIRTISSHKVNLLETEEVEWLRSLLQAIDNPRQDIPLIAALTGPIFGFSADDLAGIRSSFKNGCFYDALKASNLAKAKSFLRDFVFLRRAARLHSVPQLIEEIFSITKADMIYAAKGDGEARSANLKEFYQYVVRFSGTPGADLSYLLFHLQQCDEEGISVDRKAATEGCVQITSIHKSKGLEYPVVFICGLSRRFSMRSTSGTLLADAQLGLGLSCVDHGGRIRYPSVANNAISRKLRNDSISEELRVLYVAMTRPRDRLCLVFSHGKMRKKLTEMATLLDTCPSLLLSSRASCLGSWILYTALQRTEAGALFAVSNKPTCSRVSDVPWEICFSETKAPEEDTKFFELAEKQIADVDLIDRFKSMLSFQYSHGAATAFPSKQTATQIKGRIKDQEAQEDAPQPEVKARKWAVPGKKLTNNRGRERGDATHVVLQFLDLKNCESVDAIACQVKMLVAEGRLSGEQVSLVNCEEIAAFFSGKVGRKLLAAKDVLREFKFSILEDAAAFDPLVHGEHVLLQGVVDCAILDPDGITVIDFKTDHVNHETVFEAAEQYRSQVEIYANALSRIFEKPIREKILYFFSINRDIAL